MSWRNGVLMPVCVRTQWHTRSVSTLPAIMPPKDGKQVPDSHANTSVQKTSGYPLPETNMVHQKVASLKKERIIFQTSALKCKLICWFHVPTNWTKTNKQKVNLQRLGANSDDGRTPAHQSIGRFSPLIWSLIHILPKTTKARPWT